MTAPTHRLMVAQVTSAKRPMSAGSSMPSLKDFKRLTRSSTMQACSGRGWLSLSTRLGNGKRSFAINLHGVFLLSQQVVKRMIAQRHGSIINVSSGVGRVGRARWGAYAVSKFGLEGLTQVLADEVKEFGIRVNSVNPGPTRTEMRAEAYPEEDPLTLPTPEQITPIFVHLASAQSENVTGQMLEAQDWSEPAQLTCSAIFYKT